MLKPPLPTETLLRCPICNNTQAQEEFAQPDYYIPFLVGKRCPACTIVYLNPRLTLDSIIFVENESRIYDMTATEAETSIHKFLIPTVAWLTETAQPQGRKLLDIGCNRGLLLEAARRQGWQVTGIELADEAAKRARQEYGLSVYANFDQLDPAAHFDLITAWHVLEHTLDPVAFLRQAAARLAPGGAVAVQVPSYDFVDEFRRRDQSGGVINIVHNFYFTQHSLPMVLSKAGLQPIFLNNNASDMFLTIIAKKSLTAGQRMRKGWQLLRGGQLRSAVREVINYLRWRLRKA